MGVMRTMNKEGLCGTLLVLGCLLGTLGYFCFVHHCKVPDRNGDNGKEREYFVPDPVAMKEGEVQWLRLQEQEHINRNGNYVMYEVDGEIYQTPLFVEKINNNSPDKN